MTLRRVLASLAGVLALATVLITAWHLAPVRRALGLAPLAHPTTGTCPFGFGAAPDASAVAAYRAAHANEPRAAARPALGFTLGTTTLAELDAWATRHGLDCKHIHGGSAMECAAVPASLLGGSGTLGATAAWFELSVGGTLRSVKTVRDASEVEAVADAFDHTQAALTAAAGAPHAIDGSAAPAVLSHGALRQAMVEYRFQDYRAVVRATNMGPGHGFTLTESYVALD